MIIKIELGSKYSNIKDNMGLILLSNYYFMYHIISDKFIKLFPWKYIINND